MNLVKMAYCIPATVVHLSQTVLYIITSLVWVGTGGLERELARAESCDYGNMGGGLGAIVVEFDDLDGTAPDW